MARHNPGKVRICRHCGTEGVEGADFLCGQGNCCRDCSRIIRELHRIEVQEEGGERHERRKQQVRRSRAQRVYGLTGEQAELLYQLPGCQICGLPSLGGGASKVLNIDHCAETGRVRGALCRRCNLGLGYFLHNTETLAAAIAYLQESEAEGFDVFVKLRGGPAADG